MYLIGHRGNSATAPENTLSSLAEAFKLGADGVELDVTLTKDEQVIVFHDDTLERTTNGKGAVSNYTYDELKLLDAGSWFSTKYANEKIPLLEEVLSTLGGKGRFLIEIKDTSEKMPMLISKVVELVRKYQIQDAVEILSFHNAVINYVSENYKNEIATQKFIFLYIHPLPVLIGKEINFTPLAAFNNVHSFGFDYLVTPKLVKYIKALGKNVYLGARHPISLSTAMQLKQAGITGIMRNDVAPFIEKR